MNAALVLAAGNARRMGCCKLLLPWQGKSILAHVLELVEHSGCQPCILVNGGHYAREIRAEAEKYAFLRCVTAEPEEGQAGQAFSLRTGLCALLSMPARHATSLDGVLVFLADMPGIHPHSIARIMECVAAYPGHFIVPCWQDKRGNPVYIPACAFEAVQQLNGDAGARSLLFGTFPVHACTLDDQAVLCDVDSPAAYARLQTGALESAPCSRFP